MEQTIQPVWVFHDHNADDTIRFIAYVQAAAEELIGGRSGAGAATPTPRR